MRMILRYKNGQRLEAVLLAAEDRNMRVAVESQGDSVELFRAGESWQTDAGEEIEIEALIRVPGYELPQGVAEPPRSMAAGTGIEI